MYDRSQHTPFKPGRLHNQRWKAEICLYFPTTENAFRKCVCQLGVHSSTLVNLMGQRNIIQNATIWSEHNIRFVWETKHVHVFVFMHSHKHLHFLDADDNSQDTEERVCVCACMHT